MPDDTAAVPSIPEGNPITPSPSAPTSPSTPPEIPAASPVTPPPPPNAAGPSTRHDGPNGAFPAELNHWNWGALLLNWIWGIGHHTYIALLCFIPIGNIVMPIVLGIKGNEWAWQHRHFPGGIEEFKAVELQWTRWGVGITLVLVLISLVAMSLGFFSFFKLFSITNSTSTGSLNSYTIPLNVTPSDNFQIIK